MMKHGRKARYKREEMGSGGVLTCVNALAGAAEVVEPGQPVGKHGRRTASLLIAGDCGHIVQECGMCLSTAGAHVHAHSVAAAQASEVQACSKKTTLCVFCECVA
jgi:hypothetical protein